MVGFLVFFNLLQIVLEFHFLFGNAERQRENGDFVYIPQLTFC